MGGFGLGGSRALVHAVIHRGYFGPPLSWKAGLISPLCPGEYQLYGVKLAGIGGSSRIRVMVTRRFGDIEGLSGNSGSVSALPATMKIFADGNPSPARISRTALARSAERSQGP